MSCVVAELNDCEITVVRQGEVLAHSPGVAVIGPDRVSLGEEALKTARLDPRNTFSRFWCNLGQDRLKHPTKLARHHADLAFAHLLSLYEQAGQVDELVFAVPGSFTSEQLSLLLGLAAAAPFTVTGLVDAAVAAAATVAPGAGPCEHLDLHLHHAVMTRLEAAAVVERTAVKVIDDVGMAAVHDRCADCIAELFIRQSRFDPLHHAATEQSLHDQLPQCLRAVRQEGEVLFPVSHEGARYQARVSGEALAEALRPLCEKLAAALNPARRCLLARRLADLPGFTERLVAAGVAVEILDEHAAAAGCANYMQSQPAADGEVYFVTRLQAAPAAAAAKQTAPTAAGEQAPPPATGAAAGKPGAAGPQDAAAATHILARAEALPMGTDPLYLGASGAVLNRNAGDSRCSVVQDGSKTTLALENGAAEVLINGRRCNGGTTLAPGDVIGFADAVAEFTVIRVLD